MPTPNRGNLTRSQETYGVLRRMILTTELRPGAKLSEPDLMSQLAVGRTPLRDALRLLAHDGLVQIESRHGTIVAPLTSSDLHAVFEVRVLIEPLIASTAIASASDEDLTIFAKLAQQARNLSEPISSDTLDEAVHNELVGLSRNRFLLDIYQRLRDESLRFRYLTNSGMDSKSEQVRFVESIHQSLAERN
jgi:DNA-binding GntR family transcriptional regulator